MLYEVITNLAGAYHVLTTGSEAYEEAFDAWDRGEAALPDSSGPESSRVDGSEPFHMGFFSPSLPKGETEQTLVVRVYPVSGSPWIELRERDREAYLRAKDAAAARCISLLEKYVIPGLSSHILLRDVSTPATFARRLGSTEGACFDMLPAVSQFGMRRLPLKGPFEGLYQTKYSHGIWPALHAGVITSYSIHYTKLYEVHLGSENAPDLKGGHVLLAVHGGELGQNLFFV